MGPTTSKEAPKTERVEARVSSSEKELLATAARLEGRSLTDFVVSSAHEAAVRTLQEYHSIELTLRDRQHFFREVLEDRQPGDRMREKAEIYREYTKR